VGPWRHEKSGEDESFDSLRGVRLGGFSFSGVAGMTHLNGGGAAFPYPGSHKPDLTAVMAEARRMVEGTTLSQHAIAQRLKVSDSAISIWKKKGGWVRPEGAPVEPASMRGTRRFEQTTETRHEILVNRLFRVFDRQLKDVESRAADAVATTEEKDARTLGTLARTLGTLISLEAGNATNGRDGGDEADEPERYDPDEIRARLAERLAGLSEDEEG
jgi:transposase